MILYTAIFGGIDDAIRLRRAHPILPEGSRCVVFSDILKTEDMVGSCWEARPAIWTHLNPRRTARWHKINSTKLFPGEVTAWFDGSLLIREGADFGKLLSYVSMCDLATFKHPIRECVYQEGLACIKLKKDLQVVIDAQITRYILGKYPRNAGMVETSCVVRRDTLAVSQLEEAWWQEIDQGSLRDQLSFNFVARQMGFEYGIIPGCRDGSEWFEFRQHSRKG